jgi:Histidinol-phosphate/aromatic aminotransferase and cobyric acid decarboxylase
MLTSRRKFLRSGTAITATAMKWPLIAALRADTVESSRFKQDDRLIRLNSNENAYGPSAKVTDAIKTAIVGSNRYPRMEYKALSQRIARMHDVKPEQILLGCGSTEILRMAAFAFLGKGRHLILASPTFEAIAHYAHAAGSEVTSVPLTPTFSHDLDGMLAQADASTTLAYICNPNNPTASLTSRKDLENFITKIPASTFILIDEAYHHYAALSGTYKSFIDRPMEDERVIITRTFSNVYALAGLRLGYAIGSPQTIERMRNFATEDNINAVVTYAAAAALEDQDRLADCVRRNVDDRQEFFNQAMARALKSIDSHANFVMMNTLHPAEEVIEHFRTNNILIGRSFPPMNTYIRVSLGRPEEMRTFWQTWDKLPYAKNLMHHH